MNVQKVNYQKELERILKELETEGRVPTLLIHSCCAPCSSGFRRLRGRLQQEGLIILRPL